MLDLVYEEERIAHRAGLDFEKLLAALDQHTGCGLCDRYADLSDRYLLLAGKGRRDTAENLDLDRLATTLGFLLGERGLLIQAGRLLWAAHTARLASALFLQPLVASDELVKMRILLTQTARLADGGLRGPLPVQGEALAGIARRVAWSLSGWQALRNQPRGFFSLRAERAAAQATARLTSDIQQLDDTTVRDACWPALAAILNQTNANPKKRLEVLVSCYRLAGWAGSSQLTRRATQSLEQARQVIGDGVEDG